MGLIAIFQTLWVNLHGSFPIFFVIPFLFLFEEFAGVWLSKKHLDFDKVKLLYLLFGVGIFTGFLNPYGSEAFFWPYKFQLNHQWFSFAAEWQNTFKTISITRLPLKAFQVLLVLSLITVILNIKNTSENLVK